MMKHLPGVVFAGLLLLVCADPLRQHKEITTVWPLYLSAILLACVFALCQTSGTAPWVWSVINSVLVGLLAMNLVNLTSAYEPEGDDEWASLYRLAYWIGSYLAVSGILYALVTSGIHIGAASEALGWVIAVSAGGFCAGVFPDDMGSHEWVFGLGVLLTEQLVFYFIWILPRTLEAGSLDAWDISTHKLGKPARENCPVSSWRAECDGIIWGASPFALAGSVCKLYTHVITGNTRCHPGEFCAWDGNLEGRIGMWTKFTGAFILLTVLCMSPLQRMIDGTGLTNIAGSTMLSGMTTAVSMGFLHILQGVVSFGLPKADYPNYAEHPVFCHLLVAYLATLAACGSAIVMATFEDEVTPGSDAHNIMLKMQGSMGLQAGLAWYTAFDACTSTKALTFLFGDMTKGALAVILLSTIFPLYAYYIRPANKRAQAKAVADRAERQAVKAAHLHQH